MTNIAVVLGAEDAFGAAVYNHLTEKGWAVFVSDKDGTALVNPLQLEHVDLLICNADAFIEDSFVTGLDFETMKQVYDANALTPIRFVSTFLPLMDQGLKRLCFITNSKGSVGLPEGKDDFGYSMSKAALHMAVTILANDLARDGYTFRLYIPDANAPDSSATSAVNYFLTDRDDELRLTITDYNGEECPF